MKKVSIGLWIYLTMIKYVTYIFLGPFLIVVFLIGLR